MRTPGETLHNDSTSPQRAVVARSPFPCLLPLNMPAPNWHIVDDATLFLSPSRIRANAWSHANHHDIGETRGARHLGRSDA